MSLYYTIALDDTSVSANISSGSSYNISQVVADNPYRLLVVSVAAKLSDSGGTVSVAYNGTALTQGILRSSDVYRAGIYYLADPEVGTYNVTVSTSAGTFEYSKGAVMAFSNASATLDSTASQSSTETNPWSYDTTTVVPNGYIIDCLYHTADNDWDAAAPQVELFDWNSDAYDRLMSSYKTYTTAGAYSMTWNRTSGTDTRAGYGSIASIAPKEKKAVKVMFID